MAQSIQSLRRSILSKPQTLIRFLQIQSQYQNPISQSTNFHSVQPSNQLQFQSRNYATLKKTKKKSSSSVITKPDFDSKILRLLRKEAQLNGSPREKPPAEFNGFKVKERPGEQWITLSKQYGESEKISIEVTMFDGSVPIPKEVDKPDLSGQEEHLHITMIISIFKGESDRTLEFICSAWPDTLEIQNLFVRDRSKVQTKQPYNGPMFGVLDDDLQDSLYTFLEERGIDDNLCIFLQNYIDYKDQAEFNRWTESVEKVLQKN